VIVQESGSSLVLYRKEEGVEIDQEGEKTAAGGGVGHSVARAAGAKCGGPSFARPTADTQ